MPISRATIGLLLVPLAFAAGTGAMAHKTTASPLGCEIRTEKSSGDIVLKAVATGPEKFSGEYDFVISKRGGGGTSDITQAGEFTKGAEKHLVLGETSIGSGAGSSVKASLSLFSAGKLVCEAQYPPPK